MERNIKIDIIKGVAITLVLIGHAIQGASNIEGTDCFENLFFKTIYSFHMPLFMVISGYLFYNSHQKAKSMQTILKRKAQAFFPPILTLSFVLALISLIFSKTQTYNDIFHDFIENIFLWRFWFLWSIIINVTIIGIAFRFFNHPLRVIVLTMPLTMLIPDNMILPEHKFVYPFFVLGYIINMKSHSLIISYSKKTLLVIIASYICLLYNFDKSCYIYTSGFCILKSNWLQQIEIDIYRFTTGFIGVYLSIHFLDKISSKIAMQIFANIGRLTLGVYVLQMFAMKFITSIPKLSQSFSIMFAICFIYLATFSIFGTYLSNKNSYLRMLILGKAIKFKKKDNKIR